MALSLIPPHHLLFTVSLVKLSLLIILIIFQQPVHWYDIKSAFDPCFVVNFTRGLEINSATLPILLRKI